MSPQSISPEARKHLKMVADWFKEPEVKVKVMDGNMSLCVDKDRVEKLRPFLDEMGLPGRHGVSLWRLSGAVPIAKDPKFDNLFFPFSDVEVDGTILRLGDYERFTETKTLTAKLDCLIVNISELEGKGGGKGKQ